MPRSTEFTQRERTLWRAWTRFGDAVAAAVARDVAAESGLSTAEFDILERLVDASRGRLRQRDLAVALGWDKSRISHQLTRMEARGWLTRTKTPPEGSQVVVTRGGRAVLERARPAHARAVREHLFERLSPELRASILSLAGEGFASHA